MAKKPPPNIQQGMHMLGPGSTVHVRGVDAKLEDEILYADAEVRTPPSGREGWKEASFFVPAEGYPITLSERTHTFWTRYPESN